MYDALYPSNIPEGATMVASYIDGETAPEPGWQAKFPGATIVEIARIATHDAGNVGDVESSDMTPTGAAQWCLLRMKSGAVPSLYFSPSSLAAVVAALNAAGVSPQPSFWIARRGPAVLPAGFVANQYAANSAYDTSIVADYWPGVDDAMTPEQAAQLADLAQQVSDLWNIFFGPYQVGAAPWSNVEVIRRQLADLGAEYAPPAPGTPPTTAFYTPPAGYPPAVGVKGTLNGSITS